MSKGLNVGGLENMGSAGWRKSSGLHCKHVEFEMMAEHQIYLAWLSQDSQNDKGWELYEKDGISVAW